MFSRNKSQKYKKLIPATQWNISNLQLRNPLFCLNCGKNNHSYSQCTDPLSSYGLVCFYKFPHGYEVIMVRRKHTISYVEFLRGKYDVNNLEYLISLFMNMTHIEIDYICANPEFSKLRDNLGLDSNRKKSYKNEYENSELKFNYILNLGILHKVIYSLNHLFQKTLTLNLSSDSYPVKITSEITLAENTVLLDRLKSQISHTDFYTIPEWGLPKGKRQNKETDLQCAIREFNEETGINANNLRIYKNVIPLEETYRSNNGIEYKHTYFIAELKTLDSRLIIDNTNGESAVVNYPSEYANEISAVKLFNNETAITAIRDYYVSKRNILQKAFYIINSFRNYFNY